MRASQVLHGRHFVLIVGYDTSDESVWYVHDPGFETESYSYDDFVGYRLFEMDPPGA